MSPEESMKNPYVNIIVNWLLGSMTLLLVFWFGLRDSSAKELVKKIDDKADIIYVDRVLEKHELRDIEIITPIKEDVKELKEEDKAIRLEFLQELRLLRQDIKELYKSK